MATIANSDYRAVLDDLGRALRRRRRDCPPTETARLLLSCDGPGQPLLGLRRDGERAVYFDARGRRAVAVGFDADGLDPRGGRPIATLATAGAIDGWVERMRYYWAWRHPRYR